MGLKRTENEYYEFVSDNGLHYELLEGTTIGAKQTYSSDICFILFDDSELELEIRELDRLVGWIYGADFLDRPEFRDNFVESIEDFVGKYEAKHPELVRIYKKKKKIYAIRVEQVLADDFLVEANSLEEAIEKVRKYDEEEGISPDEIVAINVIPTPGTKENGEATEEQIKTGYWLEGK